jgi:hypothetical protein
MPRDPAGSAGRTASSSQQTGQREKQKKSYAPTYGDVHSADSVKTGKARAQRERPSAITSCSPSDVGAHRAKSQFTLILSDPSLHGQHS